MLEPQGVTFAGHRADDEQHSEFFASTDNWFRPVQVRTGPDGALWIVDMYRFVIEHPRWIPLERLKQLDPRAGADKGRIYRVYPRDEKLRPISDLTKLTVGQLAEALTSPNGPARDLAHLELSRRKSGTDSLFQRLKKVYVAGDVKSHNPPTDLPIPAVRAQMLCATAGTGKLTPEMLRGALLDPHPGVRRQAVHLCEPFLRSSNAIASGTAILDLKAALLKLADDPDDGVRYQLALSLGEWKEPGDWRSVPLYLQVSQVLAKQALADPDGRWLRAAVLSSAPSHSAAIFHLLTEVTNAAPASLSFARDLIGSASASPRQFNELFISIGKLPIQEKPAWSFGLLASLLDTLERRNETIASFAAKAENEARSIATRMGLTLAEARKLTTDDTAPSEVRVAAIPLLARNMEIASDGSALIGKDIELLGNLLKPGVMAPLQQAALDRLKRLRNAEVPAVLLRDWSAHSPSQRTAIIGVLLSREEWVSTLLGSVEQGTVSANEIPLASRQRLLKHTSVGLRDRAAKLFAAQISSSRAEVLAKYKSVSALAGAAENGAAHFDKNCSSCHAIHGHGQPVGPNLAEFAGKSVDDFLLAILDPNAAINPNFIAYSIETKDGRSLSGIVKGETASSLTLIQGGGAVEKLLRSDIQEIRASQLSLMPEGLEQSMAPQDLADLIAWLKQSAPAPYGSASAEQAARARMEFLKGGANGLARIISASEQLDYPSWLGRLPLFHCRQTDGRSKLVWQTAAVPTSLPANSTQQVRLAAAMGFLSQPSGRFQLRLNGKPVLDFDVSLSDQIWQSEDGTVRMLYTVMENNKEDSNGPLLIEVASSLLEAGKAATFEVVASPAQSQRWFGVYVLPEITQAAGR